MFNPSFTLGRRTVGKNAPPLIWPDIDVYFQSNQEEAFRLVAALRRAGGDTVKSAVIQHPDICLKNAQDVTYPAADRSIISESYRQVIERHVVPLDRMEAICKNIRDEGMDLVLSVYDTEGLSFAVAQNAIAIKIPSSNIVHKPLILQAAACGRPVVLDTGRSTIGEILRALDWLHAGGARDVILQYSPPGPPAPLSAHNLQRLSLYQSFFSGPIGLSCHHPSALMMLAAVPLGASVLEKAVVWEDGRSDIDRVHALPVAQMEQLYRDVSTIYDALGDARAKPLLPQTRPLDRMGIVAARNLPEGHILRESDIGFKFPTIGIGVEDVDMTLGTRLRRGVERDEPIFRDDIERVL